MRIDTWISVGLVVACFTSSATMNHANAAQVISVSDFQDKTDNGWVVDRLAQHVAPKLIENGGPDGGSDAYLELTALGGNGPGSRLAVFNSAEEWTGDYLELGVTAVKADLRNASDKNLEMRLLVFGDGSTNNRWTSSEPFRLPNDGQWHRATFSIAEDALVGVRGGSTYESMMSDVVRIMLRHDDGAPSAGGTRVAAKVGLDNIQLLKAIDFNGDGMLDVADVNLMLQEIKADRFSADFDLNGDKAVDTGDLKLLVTDPENLNTYIGDADLNGEFGTADLVAVFAAGEYEDGVMMNSTWETGDWTGDAEFGTGDLVAAFADGGFELGPRTTAAVVPEPTSGLLSGAIMLLLLTRRSLFSRRTS